MIKMLEATGEYIAPLKQADKFDVIVVGGGPSGCVAALSAARNGANTLLIEREGYLGGMMTGGSVNGIGINGFIFRDAADRDGGPRPYVVEGISLELYRRLQDAGGALPGKPITRGPCDSIILTHVLDDMMAESGVKVLFNSIAFDAIVENGVMKGVVVANKSGGQVYYAGVVIDCSADGDVASAAGCDFEHGRPEDGRCHGGSLDFQIGGIDVKRFVDFMKTQPIMPDAEREQFERDRQELLGGGGPVNSARDMHGNVISRPGLAPRTVDWEKVAEDLENGIIPNVRVALQGGGAVPGLVAIDENGKYYPQQLEFDKRWLDYIKAGKVPKLYGAVKDVYPPPRFAGLSIFRNGKQRLGQMQSGVYECWFDQTDQMDISRALIFMRKLNLAYFNFLRECIPGFEDIYIINEAPLVGTRESRRIMGEYYVTVEDIACGAKFDDVIGLGGPRGADAHSVTGLWGDGVLTATAEMPFVKPYDIPYRCLVPRKIDNLLVGGRCVSGHDLALGAMRDQAQCMVMGEAAGAAAALSVRLDVTPRTLDVKQLQETLKKQGVKLEVPASELQ